MTAREIRLADPVGPADHLRGPLDASVTLVEYGDFECPHCKNAAGAVKMLVARFEGQVRLVFRNYPLEEIHPHALDAALAAECAAAQGRFWQMHDLLFDHQPRFDRRQLESYARLLELDMPRFTAELDGRAYLERVRAHQRGGDASGVRATPGFYVNGRVQDVSYGLQSLYQAVEAELGSLKFRGDPVAGRLTV
jgi:protein-disulfide isomerase